MRRRDFFCAAAAGALARGAPAPDMLLAHMQGKFERIAKVREKPDGGAVRAHMREMLGPFPEKNPLNAVVAGTLERPGYRVENVMFESRPGFPVTGNLYLPSGGAGPFPAVLMPCGHTAEARLAPAYQYPCLSLVREGFVVLTFDPVGQGERRQFWDPRTGETEGGLGATSEHTIAGELLLLLGENLTNYMLWDGMRAIDYLLTRPEVDGRRIGCSGISGGGRMTLFHSAIDERIACAAVHESATDESFWSLRTGPGARVGRADTEQNLFPALRMGVDLVDIHMAIAPRPLLATIEDYSPEFDRNTEEIRGRYRSMAAGDRFGVEEATDPHGWTMKLRLANTNWFCRWFLGRKGPAREPDFAAEPAERLHCTPGGSVRHSRSGETVFSLMLKKQAALPERRLSAEEVRAAAARLLNWRRNGARVESRRLTTTPRKGYTVEKVEFLPEPDVRIPTWVFLPAERRGRGMTLWVHEGGKQADGLEFGLLERLARAGHASAAIDVRGVGETAVAGSEPGLVYHAWFLGESLFGMRVGDVVRAVDYLLGRPDVDPGGIRAVGRGMGALWVLFAAALDGRIAEVVCERGLVSYRSLVQGDRYAHPVSVFIPGVLREFDLPDVAAAVADRPLTLVAPVDAMRRPAAAAARRVYGRARVLEQDLGHNFNVIWSGVQE